VAKVPLPFSLLLKVIAVSRIALQFCRCLVCDRASAWFFTEMFGTRRVSSSNVMPTNARQNDDRFMALAAGVAIARKL